MAYMAKYCIPGGRIPMAGRIGVKSSFSEWKNTLMSASVMLLYSRHESSFARCPSRWIISRFRRNLAASPVCSIAIVLVISADRRISGHLLVRYFSLISRASSCSSRK